MGIPINDKMDFNDIGVKIGDFVLINPTKIFYSNLHENFPELREDDGPFEVTGSFPLINMTEIIIGKKRYMLSNDLLLKFHVN